MSPFVTRDLPIVLGGAVPTVVTLVVLWKEPTWSLSSLWILGFLLILTLAFAVGLLDGRKQRFFETDGTHLVAAHPYPPPSTRNTLLEMVAGLLLVAGSCLYWFLGPGASVALLTPVGILAGGLLVLGLFLAGYGAVRRPRALPRPDVDPRNTGASWPVAGALGIAAALFVVLLLTSIGALPGFYFPSSGVQQAWIVGCDTLPGITAVSVPQGFPPGAHVELRWATENGTVVRFSATQDDLNSYSVAWDYGDTAAGGSASFVGTGGQFGFAASAASNCTLRELVNVSWSYSLAI